MILLSTVDVSSITKTIAVPKALMRRVVIPCHPRIVPWMVVERQKCVILKQK